MRARCIALAVGLVAVSCGGEVAPPPTPGALPPTAAGAASPAPAGSTVKRTFVSMGRPSGTDVTTTAPDGSVTIAYDVLENGRGPHVDAVIPLAPDGTVAALDAKGHHTMGTALYATVGIRPMTD